MPKFIAEAWAKYEMLALPMHASATQRRETKRAFYAGAQSLLDVRVHNLSSNPEPTKEDEEKMTAICVELRDFAAAVVAGSA